MEAHFMLLKLRCLACEFCIFLSLIPISYLFLTRADSPGGASPLKTYDARELGFGGVYFFKVCFYLMVLH